MLFSSRRTLTFPSAVLPLLGSCLGALLLSGCFLGDAADGLACELDADCGLGVSCASDPEASGAKCCGGSCLVSGSTNGPGSTTATMGSESSSSSESGQTTAVDLCGNGVFDEGEICDATAPDGPDCGPTCTLCGNDFLDDGEGCDENDNPNCENCGYKSDCGNGAVGSGEVCDVWGLPEGQMCNRDCTELVLFDWPAQEVASSFCGEGVECVLWTQASASAAWGSGAYFNVGENWPGSSSWPEAILRSDPIAFPALRAGDVVNIAVSHSYDLNFEDPDPGIDRYVDYVELAVEPADGAALESADLPLGSEPIACVGTPGATIINDDCTNGVPAEDYCAAGLLRGAGQFPAEESGGSEVYEYTVPRGGWTPGDRSLRFTLRYDCGNLANGNPGSLPIDPDAWSISSVRVFVTSTG